MKFTKNINLIIQLNECETDPYILQFCCKSGEFGGKHTKVNEQSLIIF